MAMFLGISRVVLFLFSVLLSSVAIAEPDPKNGYDFLINGNYIGCGIPTSVAHRIDQAAFLLRWLNPVFEVPIFRDPGIPGRTGTNANLSYEFNAFTTQRGNSVINFNCLSCHASRLKDQVIMGLGNSQRDFTQDLRTLFSQSRLLYRTTE